MQEICTAIEKLDTSGGLKFPMELSLSGGPFTLEAADVMVTYKAAEGWAGAAEKGTQVAVDTRLTPDLKREGMAREVVRFVQDLRKNAGLQMEDRIGAVPKSAAPELQQAIEAHCDYIAAETLTRKWVDSFDASFANLEVKIEGAALTIGLTKV